MVGDDLKGAHTVRCEGEEASQEELGDEQDAYGEKEIITPLLNMN